MHNGVATGLPLFICMRIASKDIKQERERRVSKQGNKCALCGAPILPTDIVHLDHSHDNGSLRGALHGTCNMLLGKVERGLKRGIRNPAGFLENLCRYIETHNKAPDEMLHPTWLTPSEKKQKAKMRAKRKAKCKEKT